MVRNDSKIHTSCNRKNWLIDIYQGINLADISHSATKEMAVNRHTLACSLSTPYVWMEYGKTMVTVCLDYANKEEAWYFHVKGTKTPRWSDGQLTELSRKSHGDLSEVYASGSVCSCINYVGLVASLTYVQSSTNVCLLGKMLKNKTQDLLIIL